MTIKVGDKGLFRDQDNEPGQAAVVTNVVDAVRPIVDLLVRSSIGNDYPVTGVAPRRGQPGQSFETLDEVEKADESFDEKAFDWPTKADVKAEATLEAEAAKEAAEAPVASDAEARTERKSAKA